MNFDQNPDFLKANCALLQAPSQSNKSVPQRSFHSHFRYLVSLYLIKCKIFESFSYPNSISLTKEKCLRFRLSLFSVSREEAQHMPKTLKKDDQSIKDPLEFDFNTFKQRRILKHATLFPSLAQHCD